MRSSPVEEVSGNCCNNQYGGYPPVGGLQPGAFHGVLALGTLWTLLSRTRLLGWDLENVLVQITIGPAYRFDNRFSDNVLFFTFYRLFHLTLCVRITTI